MRLIKPDASTAATASYPPVAGGFDGDRGEFYGEDTDQGRPVKVRFLWIKHGPDHAHWEQAFSLWFFDRIECVRVFGWRRCEGECEGEA